MFLRDMVCLRNISVDTLHKGDTEDNNNNGNMIKKEAEKILKYKDLTIEIQFMWNVKANVIPALIGATGTFPK
jgi:hypothetical protein